MFALKGTPGAAALEAIEKATRAHSSEWRMLPDLPERADDLVGDLITSFNTKDGAPDGLRQTDSISVRRLTLALMLRNMESIERDVPSNEWRDYRGKFFELAEQFIITVPGLFAYGQYLPRLLGLAVAAGDHSWGVKLTRRLCDVWELLENSFGKRDEELRRQARSARQHVGRRCVEVVLAALPRKVRPSLITALLDLSAISNVWSDDPKWWSSRSRELFERDLARIPYRVGLIEKQKGIVGRTCDEMAAKAVVGDRRAVLQDLLRKVSERRTDPPKPSAKRGESAMSQPDAGTLPVGIVFPTRPFTYAEITLLDQQLLENLSQLRDVAGALGRAPIGKRDSLVG